MPSTVSEGITFGRVVNASSLIRTGVAAATHNLVRGSVCVRSSGKLTRAAADATADIVGVVVNNPAAAEDSLVEYIPAIKGNQFEATLEDFAAGTSHALVATNAFVDFALQLDTTNNRFLIDENDTTNTSVVVTGFKASLADEATQQPARVFFEFLADVTVYNT